MNKENFIELLKGAIFNDEIKNIHMNINAIHGPTWKNEFINHRKTLHDKTSKFLGYEY